MKTAAHAPVGGREIPTGRRSEEGGPVSLSSGDPLPGGGEPESDVVRVTAADVLPPPHLQPPTAQTFEKLEIPAAFRLAVENELTAGEKMLWLGRPSRNAEVHPQNLTLPFVGVGLLVLAFGIAVASLLSPGGGTMIGFLFAGALGAIGLAFLIPVLVSPATTCRYCYVVTSRRALLVEMSLWQRGPIARSYLPQQLLGLQRRDHAAVAGAGDLIFEYEFALPGNTLNSRSGSFLQQGATAGLSRSPQRVARGFLCLDQVREVDDLIRATLLRQLEQALDAPQSRTASRQALDRQVQAVSAACACGVTIEAPPALAAKWVKCPRCAAAVSMPTSEADARVAAAADFCREDGSVPADLKAKTLAGLDPNEKLVWVGQPFPTLVLARNSGYLAVGCAGILAALVWLVAALTPPEAGAPRAEPGQQVAGNQRSTPLLPIGLLFVSAGVSAVALVRWHAATRTCYALTNRRALVYKESLFGPTRDSYSPLEVSSMQRRDSWLAADGGDLIFRTVQVVSTTRIRPGASSTRVKTIDYGFLAVPHLDEVEKLVLETLIDRFVDKLNQASAL